jgi:hydrogenase maturation protein HypF
LYEIWGAELKKMTDLEPVRQYSENDLNLLLRMIESGLNTFETSSAGRLFDGLAALLGLSQVTSFEGEAAMLLQYAAETADPITAYKFGVTEQNGALIADWEPMVRSAIDDMHRQVGLDSIAARCHHTMVEMIAAVVDRADCKIVALTGGCFQNRLLLELTLDRLRSSGKEVYYHRRIPTNDGGVSLGQAAALMQQLKSEK